MQPPRTSRLAGRIAISALATLERARTLGRRKRPRELHGELHRILIAHHLFLGDTLMLTPLLAKLRERYPQAELVMTVADLVAPLYERRPYGVTAVGWNPRQTRSLLATVQRDFDLAIVPGDNRHSWLALALGARWIVAFAGDRPGYKSAPVDEEKPYSATPKHWGDMVADLIDGPPPRPFRSTDWPAPSARDFERPRAPYALLHVGASSPLKLWEPDRWRALAEWLARRGIAPVWSAGNGEESLVAACDPDRRFESFADRLDLGELWHLVSGAKLLVCPDTGVAHLGKIVGTPTVTLFGPGSSILTGTSEFWRDAPYRAVTIDPFACRDQRVLFKRDIAWVRRCARSLDQCPEPRCMQAIDLARVIAAIETLLQ